MQQTLAGDANADMAGILTPTSVDAVVVVKSSGEDRRNGLETIQAQPESLVATSTLRKAEPQEVKPVQATSERINGAV